MSSRKKSSSQSIDRRLRRPILWIGGRGLPSGSAGTQLVALGYPLHWEPPSMNAARSVATLRQHGICSRTACAIGFRYPQIPTEENLRGDTAVQELH